MVFDTAMFRQLKIVIPFWVYYELSYEEKKIISICQFNHFRLKICIEIYLQKKIVPKMINRSHSTKLAIIDRLLPKSTA